MQFPKKKKTLTGVITSKLVGDRILQESMSDHGWKPFDRYTYIRVFLTSIMGLSIGVAIKFGSTLLKAFVGSVANVFYGFFSIMIFGITPGLSFYVGASLSLIAPVIFTLFPYEEEKVYKEPETKSAINELDQYYSY